MTMNSRVRDVYTFIRESILNLLPREAVVTRIEFEGPEISIYVKNPAIIIERPDLIRTLAKTIKKRVVLRTDPSIRKPKEETKRIIHEIVPKDAEIVSIEFDEILGEVVIKAKKPGKVIGKGGSLLRRLLVETGWRPVVERAPPRQSKMLENILAHLITESDYRLKALRNIGQRIHRNLIFKDNYVRITALGGFREVGRSAILVETAESRILLDAGVNVGTSDPRKAFPRFDLEELKPEELDAVIITHAHLDHCGFLPLLFKYGYEGPVYVTRPTRDLMALLQLDYLDVAKREGHTLPYGIKEVKKMLLHVIPLQYNEVTDIAPDVRLTLYNAGHILGSAIVHLHIGDGLHNIVYTGDFKYAKTKLLDKANDTFPRVETLIMESTYGSEDMPPRDEAEKQLIEIVKRTVERGGKVLIPVLSVGRSQEIMLVLRDAMERKLLPEIPVWIEGMIDEVTAIHTAYPELLSRELKERIYRGEDPFSQDYFKVVPERSARKDIVEGDPCVIMATSGMLTGGPAVEYLKLLAPDPKNSLIFVSYQVEGTLGRKIRDGAREIPLTTPDGRVELLKINMEVYSIEGFSGHSDRRQLLSFLSNMRPKPKRIILCHGEAERSLSLANTIMRNRRRLRLPSDVEVIVPSLLDSLALHAP